MVNFKKVIAGVALAGMVLAGGTAAFADFAAPVAANDNVHTGEFYAYYDYDDNGTSEWAPAPKGMNVGCIVPGWTYDADEGSADMDIQSFTVTDIPVIGSATGNITDFAGDAVLEITKSGSNVTNVVLDLAAMETVEGTYDGEDVEGIPVTLSYSALYGAMTQNMDVYFVVR